MRKIKFDCEGRSAPTYSCSEPGNNTGHYYQAAEVDAMMTPRLWTQAMSKAWHSHLPDTEKAFQALLAAA